MRINITTDSGEVLDMIKIDEKTLIEEGAIEVTPAGNTFNNRAIRDACDEVRESAENELRRLLTIAVRK